MSDTSLRRQAAWAALLSVSVPSAALAYADPVVLWYAARSRAAQTNWLVGDDTCALGDRDCNVCAVAVPEQFADTFHAGQATWRTKPYDFNWDVRYEPSGLLGSDVFDDGNLVAREHIQGFVRTNSPTYPFAGSHSDDGVGGVFFVHQREDGVKKLATLHAAEGSHPSGLHTLGRFVAVAERTGLRLFDVEQPRAEANLRITLPEATPARVAGGGLGLAKLRGGGTVLVTAPRGGDNETTASFWFLHGDPAQPSLVAPLGNDERGLWRAPLAAEPAWARTSENLSLVTECGTGVLYTLHTTGDDGTLANLGESRAIWRLSRVEWDANGPFLAPVDHAFVDQNRRDCHLRSAATAHAAPDGRLHFYCHERSAHEGVGDSESFYFREGVPYEP